MSLHRPSVDHKKFRDDVVALLRKHAGSLDAQEMLAVAAHLVGQIIALQDQRMVTPDAAIMIVQRNIEQGNAEAIGSLRGVTPGGSA